MHTCDEDEDEFGPTTTRIRNDKFAPINRSIESDNLSDNHNSMKNPVSIYDIVNTKYINKLTDDIRIQNFIIY